MLLCACFAVTSCYDDSLLRADIDKLEDRVEALEDWQKSVNSEISTIKSLINALEEKNFISEVKEIEGGYEIILQTGEVLKVKHGTNGIDGEDGKDGADGKDGHSPEIGVALDNGVYYWTLDGKFILDDKGNKLPVTGPKGDKGEAGEDGEDGKDGEDAVAPQVRINKDTNYWEISTDGGKTWTSTDVKATGPKGEQGDKGDKGDKGEDGEDGEDGKNGSRGDSKFYDVIVSDSEVKFILNDTNKTEFSLPRVGKSAIVIGDDTADVLQTYKNGQVTLTFPGLKEANYSALMVELLLADADYRAIATKASITIENSKVVFPTNSNPYAIVTFTETNTGNALLRVTLIDKDGNEIQKTRALNISGSFVEAVEGTAGTGTPTFVVEKNETTSTDITIDSGESLILDLSGSTINNTTALSTENSAVIIVKGTLEITGTGSITATNVPAIIVDGGTLTLPEGNAVNITSNASNPAIQVKSGTVTIKGGNFNVTGTSSASLTSYSTKSVSMMETSTPSIPEGCVIYAHTGATIKITGGTFAPAGSATALNLLAVEGTGENAGKITVSGGKFYGFNPTKFVTEGLVATQGTDDNGTYYEVGAPKDITTEALLRSAVGAEWETIELAADITLTSPLIFTSTTTLNLNNRSLTPADESFTAAPGTDTDSDDALIYVTKGADLTISGSGSIDVKSKQISGAIILTEKKIDGATASEEHQKKTAKLTIDGPTINGYQYAISGNGNRHNTAVIINSGTLSAYQTNNNSAIYHPQDGTLEINGGTFTGYNTAIEMRAGTLTLNGGTFTATGKPLSTGANGSGSTVVGAAIAISQHSTDKNVALEIPAGSKATLDGLYAIYQCNLTNDTSKASMSVANGTFNGKVYSENCGLFISGGTFSDPSALNYLTNSANVTVDLKTKTVTSGLIKVQGNGQQITLKNGIINIDEAGNDDTDNAAFNLATTNATLNITGVTLNVSNAAKALVCGSNDKSTEGNTITISNSTIKNTKNDGTGIQLKNNHTLTLDNSHITHNWFGITQNGNSTGSAISMTGGSITGKYSGIYMSNQQNGNINTLTVKGATITSTAESAIEVKKTNITVTGSTLTSNATSQSYSLSTDGSNGIGYGIVLAGYEEGKQYEGTVKLSATEKVDDDNTYILAAENASNVYIYGTVAVSGNTYTIFNKEGMFWLADQVNSQSNTFSGKTVELAANIDLQNQAWAPIGQTGATQFSGTFDGKSHTISKLTINNTDESATCSTGLFGWNAGIKIYNLIVDKANVTGHHNVGVIAGYIEVNAVIDNCKVTNTAVVCSHINGEACGDKAGTIVGFMNGTDSVTNCVASDCTVKASRDAGQIVGCAGKNATVTGCSANNVTVSEHTESACTDDGKGTNINDTVIGRQL